MLEDIFFTVAQRTTELISSTVNKAVDKEITKGSQKILLKMNNDFVSDLKKAGYEVEE